MNLYWFTLALLLCSLACYVRTELYTVRKIAVNEQWIFYDWLYNFVDYSLEQTVKPTEIVQEVKQYYK